MSTADGKDLLPMQDLLCHTSAEPADTVTAMHHVDR